MYRTIAGVMLALPVAALAANINCDTKAPEHATKAEKAAMAKISTDTARKTALNSVNASGAQVTKNELEVEKGCLVYSFDIKVPGKSGVHEILVDAGTGKVVATEHESAVKEAAENAADKVQEAGQSVKNKGKKTS